MYPIDPLYDLESNRLKDQFKRAISRIFRLLDVDYNNRLSKEDFINYHKVVYNNELSKEDLL